MKILEMIRLRAPGHDAKNELARLLADMEHPQHLDRARLYSQADVPGDISILLTWRSDGRLAGANRSPLGLSLAQKIQRFGIVDHSVWVENQ